MERDICQPIYITVKEDKTLHYFILLIEDAELKKSGDPKPYKYVLNWGVPLLIYFATPLEAYIHARSLFPQDKTIDKVTSLSMNEFLTDNQL